MSRQALPFFADDVSNFARALRRELTQSDQENAAAPSHLTLLNMVARAGGYQNFQHFRAQAMARQQLDHASPGPATEPADFVAVGRLARYFDGEGRLARWPSKYSHRVLCLWVLWSRLEPRRVYTEAEINRALDEQHLFGDYALLRRDLCDESLMTRTVDGREYRRVEQTPPATPLALIRHLAQRLPA
ncbi:DUF2087 domain-containing protein [Pseudolabrys taiwanensis]|uniref:DUF2087 domain-containing protein n=1 Tax=Pseudolabrys taiwanensis TaxID=331696 RepID=A0A345ZSX6_9HYPH|nr:DUF2087 domain-containing protein [Pseudolabrys taiwanensis]AXK80023.1 DUF2087 domain-containing protein [Pseudolabrys taiwanensis]